MSGRAEGSGLQEAPAGCAVPRPGTETDRGRSPRYGRRSAVHRDRLAPVAGSMISTRRRAELPRASVMHITESSHIWTSQRRHLSGTSSRLGVRDDETVRLSALHSTLGAVERIHYHGARRRSRKRATLRPRLISARWAGRDLPRANPAGPWELGLRNRRHQHQRPQRPPPLQHRVPRSGNTTDSSTTSVSHS